MSVQVDQKLDAKGLYCPMPAVKTSMHLQQMEQGQILEVLTTDVASKRDLPKWAEETGNKLIKMETDTDGVTRIFIQKSDN